jgi:hypothetical protein
MATKNDSSIWEVLRDQLALFSFLVIFVGITSSEAYYSSMGVRYVFMNFPVTHYLYRGVVLIANNWEILIPYLVVAIWLSLPEKLYKIEIRQCSLPPKIIHFFIVALLLIISMPIAWFAGVSEYQRDVTDDKSYLPQVRKLKLKIEHDESKYQNLRYVISQGDFVIFLRPIHDVETEVHHLLYLNKGDISEYSTNK